MADSYPEKIIPLIHIKRKVLACNSRQQLAALKQLPEIFESQRLTSVLTDIIFSGICNRDFYDRISPELYHEIEAVLPEDNQLDLKDSIYESQMLELPANRRKKRLPLTLLRIPSDLQCHLFLFLNIRDLMDVQRVCRSLCIMARNPCSLYALEIDAELSTNHHFFNESYSRPKLLSICHSQSIRRKYRRVIGNAKWGESVSNLCIDRVGAEIDLQNLGIFVNLEKCQIKWTRSILVNGQITSYHTLRELHIKGVRLTEDIIDEIRKFKNLEVLTLGCGAFCDSNLSEDSALVKLPRLREFSYSTGSARLFQKILIGSHPEVVKLEHWQPQDIPDMNAAVEAIRAIKYLHLDLWNSVDVINSLSPLLLKAQRLDSPLFEECKLSVKIQCGVDYDVSSALQPITTLMECGKTSKFHLISDRMVSSNVIKYDIVDFIRSSAPNTFNEITMNLTVVLYPHCIWRELDGIDIGEGDHEMVRNVVMEDIDEVEKWMKWWLVFDEQTMKQIGLQKLDIKFQYEAAFDFDDEFPDLVGEQKAGHFETIMRKMTDVWLQKRMDGWSDMDSRCVSMLSEDGLGYTVALSVRA